MSAPLLSFDAVTLRFGGVTALDDVSFTVSDGELFAIIGPNGAGKTSIFNCLNGVYRPESGEITFRGKSLIGTKPTQVAKHGVARTFQNLGLFSNLNLVDNLMLGRHLLMKSGFITGALWFGRAKREEIHHRGRVEEIIDFLDLQPHRYSPVGMLPYGIQKRIELGRALAMEPSLLLLDEPVAGMNLEETEDMARFIIEVRDRLHIAMILVEHDMHMVMDIADRVMALNFGQCLATGVPSVIQSDPEVIAAYLGEPA
ncbi:MAG: ABC transporter ATP-binding protein [Acidimicrobiaceae bacterium]|nr:ABC transporter ATP-binding protein [Acidimicrobiaceae bacterium]